MIRTFAFAAVALALVAGAASADATQLAIAAGVSPAEAGAYSVNDLARMKRNAETGRDEQAPLVGGSGSTGGAGRSQLIAAAGLTQAEAADMTVAQLAIVKSNREARRDDVHPVVSSRSVAFESAGRAQIVASVFNVADAADGLTMHEIYRAKIAREASDN
jgi:hypothetical protein